jgi:hypothetical protein
MKGLLVDSNVILDLFLNDPIGPIGLNPPVATGRKWPVAVKTASKPPDAWVIKPWPR